MKKSKDGKVEQYIQNVTDEMSFCEARHGAGEEILSHIEEHIDVAESYGVAKEKAVNEALNRMGDPKELGKSLNRIHQPKLDWILPVLVMMVCGFGLQALSNQGWALMQMIWMSIGIALAVGIYFLPVKSFINVIAGFYPVAVVALIASYFSGVVYDGQPYLSLLGLNIKIVDLAGVLFALGFPALDFKFKKSMKHNSFIGVGLFLGPMMYFALNAFVWPGLLFLISGLCFLSLLKMDAWKFLVTGFVAAGLLASRFVTALVPAGDRAAESHTDYILTSLQSASAWGFVLCVALLVVVAVYGARLMLSIQDGVLRSFAAVGVCLLGVQILVGVLANVGMLPMIQAGIHVPFMSYGGSGIVANFLVVGVLVACFKRKMVRV